MSTTLRLTDNKEATQPTANNDGDDGRNDRDRVGQGMNAVTVSYSALADCAMVMVWENVSSDSEEVWEHLKLRELDLQWAYTADSPTRIVAVALGDYSLQTPEDRHDSFVFVFGEEGGADISEAAEELFRQADLPSPKEWPNPSNTQDLKAFFGEYPTLRKEINAEVPNNFYPLEEVRPGVFSFRGHEILHFTDRRR